MRLRTVWIPLVLLTAACSSAPTAPSVSSEATGLTAQAFTAADQPCVGDPNTSRPSMAPPEFTAVSNSAGTGALFDARKTCNAVRWQLQIVRHDPTDQPFDITITLDGRPAYEWLPAATLLNRAYDARIRAAWPSGEVSQWTPWKTFSIGSRPPAFEPVAPTPPCLYRKHHHCHAPA